MVASVTDTDPLKPKVASKTPDRDTICNRNLLLRASQRGKLQQNEFKKKYKKI